MDNILIWKIRINCFFISSYLLKNIIILTIIYINIFASFSTICTYIKFLYKFFLFSKFIIGNISKVKFFNLYKIFGVLSKIFLTLLKFLNSCQIFFLCQNYSFYQNYYNYKKYLTGHCKNFKKSVKNFLNIKIFKSISYLIFFCVKISRVN